MVANGRGRSEKSHMTLLCRLEEIEPNRVLHKRLDNGLEVAVVSLPDATLIAIENWCPHKGGPLAFGKIQDGVVTCPWHGFRYDLRTGQALGIDQTLLRAHVFQLAVREGNVYLVS